MLEELALPTPDPANLLAAESCKGQHAALPFGSDWQGALAWLRVSRWPYLRLLCLQRFANTGVGVMACDTRVSIQSTHVTRSSVGSQSWFLWQLCSEKNDLLFRKVHFLHWNRKHLVKFGNVRSTTDADSLSQPMLLDALLQKKKTSKQLPQQRHCDRILFQEAVLSKSCTFGSGVVLASFVKKERFPAPRTSPDSPRTLSPDSPRTSRTPPDSPGLCLGLKSKFGKIRENGVFRRKFERTAQKRELWTCMETSCKPPSPHLYSSCTPLPAILWKHCRDALKAFQQERGLGTQPKKGLTTCRGADKVREEYYMEGACKGATQPETARGLAAPWEVQGNVAETLSLEASSSCVSPPFVWRPAKPSCQMTVDFAKFSFSNFWGIVWVALYRFLLALTSLKFKGLIGLSCCGCHILNGRWPWTQVNLYDAPLSNCKVVFAAIMCVLHHHVRLVTLVIFLV